MIDTHCHLWFSNFKNEVQEVVQRAKDSGVHTLICVGCDEESSKQSVELSKQYENVYATIGLHPTDCKKWRGDGTLQFFRELLQQSQKIVAIGEIGIDYYHQPFDAEFQKKMFREQCLLAQEHNLPIIVHLRSGQHAKALSETLTEAETDCLSVLDQIKPKKVLFHCFSGDRTLAKEVLNRGWYLSFSGVLSYPKADERREVVKECPMDRMMVETDCPFLAPQSHRGERNEPAFVVETAKLIADLKKISFQELDVQLDQNVHSFFALH